MRNIAVVALSCVFAVGVAGQQQPAGVSLLDQAVVAEHQEHDLDKALRLYREAFEKAVAEDDSSGEMRVGVRLHQLLVRLGRTDEAKAHGERLASLGIAWRVYEEEDAAQDPEREQELREKARELLSRLGKGPSEAGGPIPGLSPELGEQLLWIGQPAAPEIIARLQAIQNWPSPEEWATVPSGVQHMADNSSGAGLMRVLWKLRGPQADAFLTACAADPKLSWVAARTGGAASTGGVVSTAEIDPDLPLFRAYLEHQDPRIGLAFLGSEQLGRRLAPSLLLDIAEGGGAALRGYALEVLGNRDFDVALLPRLHELARRGLAGTDPAWGKAAEQFLCGTSSQRTVEGLELLLGRLPELRGQQLQMGGLPWVWYGGNQRLSAADVQQLLPAIEACVARFPTRASGAPMDAATRCLEALLQAVVRAGDDDTVRKALGWWDKGFDMLEVLGGRVNGSNAVEVLARRSHVAAEQIDQFLRLFRFEGPLPGELYEPIEAMTGEVQVNHLGDLAAMLVRTGEERVVGWMLQQWQKDRSGERIVTRSQSQISSSAVGDEEIQGLTNRLAWQMMVFAKSNRGEQVRDGMLRMLHGTGPRRPEDRTRARLLMAALTLGGEEALQCFAADGGQCNTVVADYHPFLSRQTGKRESPLAYLVIPGSQPPHGYSDEQVFDAVQQLLRQRPEEGLLDPGSIDVASMPERLVALFAAEDPFRYEHGHWDDVAVAELSRRLQIGEPTPALEQWFGAQLAAHDGSDALLVPCYPNVVARFRQQLAAVLTGDEERWAYRAAQLLWQVDRGIDITAALQNRHGLVRQWAVEQVVAGEVEVPLTQLLPLLADSDEDVREELARHFGAIVSKEAVPELIGLLRDPIDSVRTAAAEALTRIRFYHEQQAHWDRVNQGMDASPASACEKLLLQAKPGQPAAQRLLAVESLGTLGVPEALPFLIDWTTDPDEAVAKAARAAITAIHLRPRR